MTPIVRPLAVLAALGTIIRLKAIVPVQISFMASPNLVLSYVFPSSKWTSLEFSYLASLIYVAAFLAFRFFLPRDVLISSSQIDYVNRSLERITKENIINWLSRYCDQIKNNEIVISDRNSRLALKYLAHLKAIIELGDAVSLEPDTLEVIKTLLQCRYDYLNGKSKYLIRICIYVLVLSSSLLGILATADGLLRSIVDLPWLN